MSFFWISLPWLNWLTFNLVSQYFAFYVLLGLPGTFYFIFLIKVSKVVMWSQTIKLMSGTPWNSPVVDAIIKVKYHRPNIDLNELKMSTKLSNYFDTVLIHN